MLIKTKVDDIGGKRSWSGLYLKLLMANDEKKVIRAINVTTGADGKAIATGVTPGDYKFIEGKAAEVITNKIQKPIIYDSESHNSGYCYHPLKQLNKRR